MAERNNTGRIAVRLKNKAVPSVAKGHPWVFSDSIDRVSREGGAGDVAVVFDRSGRTWLGAGLYDPDELVRVKVLTHKKSDPPVGEALFSKLISEAKAWRPDFKLSGTNAWRAVHGESDSFPGLVADIYNTSIVIKIYSAAWAPHLEDVMSSFGKVYPFIERYAVRLSRNIRPRMPANTPFTDGSVFPPEKASGWDGTAVFSENGILFRADLLRGQKTGFFLDQRDNRAEVERISKGKRVLNVFSFSGGFSLYAARGGASEVVSIDLDPHAAEAVAENFALNLERFSAPHREICSDAFDAMEKLFSSGERFDVVIVDPPSFAKAGDEVNGALNTYARLAKLAVRLVVPGGTLVFASCSSRVTADELFSVVKSSANAAGRRIEEIKRTAHAADHPAKFRESSYLKCMYASV